MKIALVVCIFISVNFFPTGWIGEEPIDVSLNFNPHDPYNSSLLNTDTTLTLMIKNEGDKSRVFKCWIDEKSDNLFVNGRDGEVLPAIAQIDGKDEYYQSFALIPKDTKENKMSVRISLRDVESGFSISKTFYLNILKPGMKMEDLKTHFPENGNFSNSQFYLIPRYRRYWHPEMNYMRKREPGYVWLIVEGENNFLLDDSNGEILSRDLELPWNHQRVRKGRCRLWNGSNFEEKFIPTVEVKGDTSHDMERFELYFALRDNDPAWVSRRILYWDVQDSVDRRWDEIPDTERIELWFSPENYDELFTISDYHHHAFRHGPVGRYTIQTFYHCPLASNSPQVLFDFNLAEYEVYLQSSFLYDQQGFSESRHPVDKVIKKQVPLLVRNFVGAMMAVLVFLVPFFWKRVFR